MLIHYRILTHAELAGYPQDPGFLNSPVVPISPARALSYLHNPDSEPQDPAIFLAYDEQQQLRGYLGTLPDNWFLSGEKVRCAWLSCLWIDPACRGKGIAGKLLEQAHEAWHGKLALTEFTPAARALYDRSGLFTPLEPLVGLRVYRRPDFSGMIPRRWPKSEVLMPVWRSLDRFTESAISMGESFLHTRTTIPDGSESEKNKGSSAPAFRLLKLPVDSEVAEFINQFQKNAVVRRGGGGISWISTYPWLREGAPDFWSRRYHFSSVARQFRQLYFSGFGSDGEVDCFLSLSIRDGFMKIPYVMIQGDLKKNLPLLLRQQMAVYHAHTLLVYHAPVVKLIQENSNQFMHLRPAKREYMLSKPLALQWREAGALVSSLQDGDGDAAFT